MRKLWIAMLVLCPLFVFADETPKHRLGVYAGYFMPSSGYKEPNTDFTLAFEDGVSFGMEYTYALTELVGVGLFLEKTSFGAKEKDLVLTDGRNPYHAKAKADIDSTVFGAAAALRKRMDALTLYAAGKLGLAYNYSKIEISAALMSSSETRQEIITVIEGELGARYDVVSMLDLGLSLRYRVNRQSSRGVDTSLDLSGFIVAVGAGFNF